MRFHLHLLYDNHSAVDVDGQEFRDAYQAREEATIALVELWINHGSDDSKAPTAIAISDVYRSSVTVVQLSAIKTTFQLEA